MKAHRLDRVLDDHLCAGCGACAYLGQEHGVRMVDVPDIGRRPVGVRDLPILVKDQIAAVCPGSAVCSPAVGQPAASSEEVLVGPTTGVWEGWALDPRIRHAASSGGVVTALAAYCLEQLGMKLVVHTGMDPADPWLNRTVISTDRDGLVSASGSRYAPSSPVEALRAIETADGPCVFIGKPCDVAAVAELRKVRPALDRNLGLVLSFFCAGTPATNASLNLAASIGFPEPGAITSLKYRGEGWPGRFRVRDAEGREASLTYEESWGSLAKQHRQLRCQLCPDGLGELADVTGGDAWHRRGKGSDGISLILARTDRGRSMVTDAAAAGYLAISTSDPAMVVQAQGLVRRRRLVMARMAGLRLFGLATPRYLGFRLLAAARLEGPRRFVNEFAGTLQRVIRRRYRTPERWPDELGRPPGSDPENRKGETWQ